MESVMGYCWERMSAIWTELLKAERKADLKDTGKVFDLGPWLVVSMDQVVADSSDIQLVDSTA